MINYMWQNDINKESLEKLIKTCIDVNMWEDYLKIAGKFTMSWS